MSHLDYATDVRLKDGTLISVHRSGGVIVTTPIDEAVEATGLFAYRIAPIGSSGRVMHSGMPVEIVRAYCRAHGGVAEIGETAQRLLRTLPSQADPVMAVPVTDPCPPAVQEAAPADPVPPVAQLAFQLDELTEAVIEARRAVADFEGPVVWKKAWGKHAPDRLPEVAALCRRISKGASLASRLSVVTQPRFAAHPLLAEGVRLRAQLQQIREDASAMKRAREDEEMRHAQRLNGLLIERAGDLDLEADRGLLLSTRLRESLS